MTGLMAEILKGHIRLNFRTTFITLTAMEPAHTREHCLTGRRGVPRGIHRRS